MDWRSFRGFSGGLGSAVTAVSCSFYKALAKAGAPVGALRPTPRKLRGANGSQFDILGCSSCVVSFLGLRTEFPILVCDLSTDAIIGTDTFSAWATGVPRAPPPGQSQSGIKMTV